MNEYLEKLRQKKALGKAIAEEEEKAKHTSIGSLDWAIERMREGEKVHRPDWKDKTARIYMDILNRIIWESDNGEHFVWDLDDWKSPISDEYRDSGWEIYETKPTQYKVGDFVVCTYYRSPLPPKNSYERVIEVSSSGIVTKSNDGYVTEYDINGNHGDINGWHIERVISPCEHIVTIGCLSGTIKDLSYAENGRFWFIGGKTERCIGGMHCILYLEMLDTQTREIVESLLKAQEEE